MSARQLADLIDMHAATLALFARQWCSAAEDVVQEAFCKLAGQKTWPADPLAWLYRVVRNGAIDAGKAERRRKRREAAVARPMPWFEETHVAGLDAASAVTALKSLPAEQSEVIIARIWGGRTFEEIASTAGCSVSSAYRRFEAGIKAIREYLRIPCPKT